jgi:hypothetical protein
METMFDTRCNRYRDIRTGRFVAFADVAVEAEPDFMADLVAFAKPASVAKSRRLERARRSYHGRKSNRGLARTA